MKSTEKENITKLRNEGYGYTAIANELNISINTIKSFCKANNLGGVKAKRNKQKKNISFCLNCGKELEHTPGKKKKKYCSDKCRYQWWNNNRDNNSTYQIKCKSCNKKFNTYKNSNRKYCSHQCYIADRFKGTAND
ncbi:MAG: helix-turn-helix domain-containing protein [Spirochaetia bacterium]|nr:helix-turn-helix domain-containing protein [Spirochaetia bacterium]